MRKPMPGEVWRSRTKGLVGFVSERSFDDEMRREREAMAKRMDGVSVADIATGTPDEYSASGMCVKCWGREPPGQEPGWDLVELIADSKKEYNVKWGHHG